MKTELLLIRHAETDWNRENRAQGSSDISDVTEEGARQAQTLRKRLRNENIDVVYTSLLKRARKTVDIIFGESGKPIIVEEGLVERDFGEIDGMKWVDVDKERPRFYEHYRKTGELLCEGAESVESVAERAERVIRKVASENPGKTVAIIGHGTFFKIFLMSILNSKGKGVKSYTEIGQKNCALNVVEWDGSGFEVKVIDG